MISFDIENIRYFQVLKLIKLVKCDYITHRVRLETQINHKITAEVIDM